jgi:SNF2 family DNA or RNA helicase
MNLELYSFQKTADEKFSGVPAILNADDMGLGKTVQGIARDLRLRKKHQGEKIRTLIVAPLSVLSVWEEHYQRYAPELKLIKIDPKDRPTFVAATLRQKHDVYICHWESLRLMPELRKMVWDHLIGDEVHRIGNRKTQMTQSFKKIRASMKSGYTGTPPQPENLWSILNWLYPRQWISFWRFRETYVDVEKEEIYVRGQPRIVEKIKGVRNEKDLQARIYPYFIRRQKSQVLSDLPEKTYSRIWVDLTPQQRRAYDQMRKHMLAWVGAHENEPIAAPVVVAQLVRLQQFSGAYGELVPQPDGTIKYRLAEPSTKLDDVMDILESMNEKDSLVVFSQSKQMVNLLARRLHAAKITYGLLTGDVKESDRGRVVADFQAGRVRVFAGTIAAGGVGITLTKASRVVFLDRTWSALANRQAEDRLHRIGQKNAVQVIDIMARNTVDLGRFEQFTLKWSHIQKLLGDKTFDYQQSPSRLA